MARDAALIRRQQDLQRLRELIRESDGRIRLVGATGDPVDRLKLVLNYRTVASSRFPDDSHDSSEIDIVLPQRYPFVAPKVTIKTPIFHPNVYSSGLVCLGETWIATEGLDLLVRRLIRLVTFDPLVSGGMPPANQPASAWYHHARKQNPTLFPTEVVKFGHVKKPSKIAFLDSEAGSTTRSGGDVNDRTSGPDRIIVRCTACGKALRLPIARTGMVRCPACQHRFHANTSG